MANLFLNGQPLRHGENMADIQAVLFDKDGTMSRSEPKLLSLATSRIRHCLSFSGPNHQHELADLLHRAFGVLPSGESVDPAGLTAVAARDHNLIAAAVALTQVGHGWPESLEIAEGAFHLADVEATSEPPASEMTEGLRDLLADLHRDGVQCAVISNDDVSGITDFLQQHGFSELISAIWSAEHHPRKPNPKAVAQLCSGLGVAPANCALIGDANSDLRMGQSAGVAVVLGYRGGWRRPVKLDQQFPLLDHWSELALRGDCATGSWRVHGHKEDGR